MNQVFETQLQVVQRALADVVSPALNTAGAQVSEQLALSIATLAFMQQRLPHARRYYREVIENYIDMVAAIIDLLADQDADLEELHALKTRAGSLLDSPIADIADYRTLIADVRAAISDLTAKAEDTTYETALDRLILARSAPIIMRERVWCAPMGFELRPNDLPKFDWMKAAE